MRLQCHAGVQDLEAAKATVAFAERFELLDKKALSNLQLRQVEAGEASGLPRYSRHQSSPLHMHAVLAYSVAKANTGSMSTACMRK